MKFFLPFSWLYGGITDIRNWLYNHKKISSFRFEVPMISVGNLTVGGTGKTPHIEHLIRFLQNHFSIATLSRGYGRKTKGVLLAHPQTSSTEIGDEPMQFYEKFGKNIIVSVGEERALAIPYILHDHPEVNLILLDDAFQHRPVQPDVNILLTDYKRLFYNDHPFPVGRLRERRHSAKRADIILVTKCQKNLSENEQQNIIQNIQKYNAHAPVFFTYFDYAKPSSLFLKKKTCSKNVALVSAIAQPKHFESDMKLLFDVHHHFSFPDHYFFSERDLQSFLDFLEKNPDFDLICTEKDAVKLREMHVPEAFENRFFSVGIEVCFIQKEVAFQEYIQEKLQKRILQIQGN
ncbi:MAG: tetraacyldisaccharide 4'-kinase [Raineya sp.]|jgi:tetraacyldisaccharide 4'-kinase|nr:tetraacyldisaccharide 4'-kinase [Raineya sp.]